MLEEVDASPLHLVLVNAQDQRCWHLVLHQCLLDVPKAFQAFVGANAEGVVQGHEPVEGGQPRDGDLLALVDPFLLFGGGVEELLRVTAPGGLLGISELHARRCKPQFGVPHDLRSKRAELSKEFLQTNPDNSLESLAPKRVLKLYFFGCAMLREGNTYKETTPTRANV